MILGSKAEKEVNLIGALAFCLRAKQGEEPRLGLAVTELGSRDWNLGKIKATGF